MTKTFSAREFCVTRCLDLIHDSGRLSSTPWCVGGCRPRTPFPLSGSSGTSRAKARKNSSKCQLESSCPAFCYGPRCLMELEPKIARQPSSAEWKHCPLVINGCSGRHHANLFSNSPCCNKVVIASFFCGSSESLLLVFHTPSSLTAAASFLGYFKVADCFF